MAAAPAAGGFAPGGRERYRRVSAQGRPAGPRWPMMAGPPTVVGPSRRPD